MVCPYHNISHNSITDRNNNKRQKKEDNYSRQDMKISIIDEAGVPIIRMGVAGNYSLIIGIREVEPLLQNI